jgi:hypothetical protein
LVEVVGAAGFVADAGHFEAAEGSGRVDYVVAVHPHGAGLDVLGVEMRFVDVLGPDRGGDGSEAGDQQDMRLLGWANTDMITRYLLVYSIAFREPEWSDNDDCDFFRTTSP